MRHFGSNRAAVIAPRGIDKDAPGLRSQYHLLDYAAYVFALDSYKLEAVCH